MKNINLETNNYYFLKILFYLMISIFMFLCKSKITFSNDLNMNINNLNTSEEQIAIRYCDAINKKIFKGLNKEASLKYEYYFSSFKKPSTKDHKLFLKIFKLKVMKNCSYKFTEEDNKEFTSFIKNFWNIKNRININIKY